MTTRYRQSVTPSQHDDGSKSILLSDFFYQRGSIASCHASAGIVIAEMSVSLSVHGPSHSGILSKRSRDFFTVGEPGGLYV